MTISHFSPIHRYIADITVFFYGTIGSIMLGTLKGIWDIFLWFCCDIGIIIGILIYLEVIIIHVFNMEKNTQTNIEQRGESDNKKIEDFFAINSDSSFNSSIDEE